MRSKVLSSEPSEVSIGHLGLKQISSAERTPSLLTQPGTSSNLECALRPKVLPSFVKSKRSSNSSRSSSKSSKCSSTASVTNSIASSQTSLTSSLKTSSESVGCRRLGAWDTSILSFPIPLRKLITSQQPPAGQLWQSNCVRLPVERKVPRLVPYWPKHQSRLTSAKENDSRWRTHTDTPWEGYYINQTTLKYEQVSQNLPSCPTRSQSTSALPSIPKPQWETIGGDRYRCFEKMDRSTKMEYILERMDDIADVCGLVGLEVEVRGFCDLTYHDLLRMKYAAEIKKIHQEPTEETLSDGVRVVRGFPSQSELHTTEKVQNLLAPHPYSSHDYPVRPAVVAVHAHFRIPDAKTPKTPVSKSFAAKHLLYHQYEYGSLGIGEGTGVLAHPQPTSVGGVSRKLTQLEKLQPIGPKGFCLKRSATTRQFEKMEDPDAMREAKWGISPTDHVKKRKIRDNTAATPTAKAQISRSTQVRDFAICGEGGVTTKTSQQGSSHLSTSKSSWQTEAGSAKG